MRVWTIIDKEWAEVRHNKMILISMALLPVLFVAIGLGSLFAIVRDTGNIKGLDQLPAALALLDPRDALMILMANQFLFMFLVMPVALPVYIAAYSIIGEKETRSLEPLLATPVRIWELLLGKSVAAALPAVLITWAAFAAFVAGMRFMASDVVLQAIVSPMWLMAMLLAGPLLALLSVFFGIIASSRINDPRAVQQLTAIFVVPVIILGTAQLSGRFLINAPMFAVGIVALAVLDAAVLYIAVKLFQRETILTKWK